MGAIQNAMNQMTGAITGAAAAYKHVSNQKTANEIAAIEAQDKLATEQAKTNEEIANTNSEIKEIKGKIKEGNAEIKTMREAAPDEPGMGTPAGGEEAYREHMDNIKALRKSKNELNKQVKAKKMSIAEREQHIQRLTQITKLKGGIR